MDFLEIIRCSCRNLKYVRLEFRKSYLPYEDLFCYSPTEYAAESVNKFCLPFKPCFVRKVLSEAKRSFTSWNHS
jgi:hypothetical protein